MGICGCISLLHVGLGAAKCSRTSQDPSSISSSFDNMWRCPRSISTIVCVHEPACEPADCSGHGDCVQGQCHCAGDFWRGPACDTLDCGPSNCSLHGTCTACESLLHAARRVPIADPELIPQNPSSGRCGGATLFGSCRGWVFVPKVSEFSTPLLLLPWQKQPDLKASNFEFLLFLMPVCFYTAGCLCDAGWVGSNCSEGNADFYSTLIFHRQQGDSLNPFTVGWLPAVVRRFL